jgi:hypothetical protein
MRPTKTLIAILLVFAVVAATRALPDRETNAERTTPSSTVKVEQAKLDYTDFTRGDNGRFYKPGETADNPQDGY